MTQSIKTPKNEVFDSPKSNLDDLNALGKRSLRNQRIQWIRDFLVLLLLSALAWKLFQNKSETVSTVPPKSTAPESVPLDQNSEQLLRDVSKKLESTGTIFKKIEDIEKHTSEAIKNFDHEIKAQANTTASQKQRIDSQENRINGFGSLTPDSIAKKTILLIKDGDVETGQESLLTVIVDKIVTSLDGPSTNGKENSPLLEQIKSKASETAIKEISKASETAIKEISTAVSAKIKALEEELKAKHRPATPDTNLNQETGQVAVHIAIIPRSTGLVSDFCKNQGVQSTTEKLKKLNFETTFYYPSADGDWRTFDQNKGSDPLYGNHRLTPLIKEINEQRKNAKAIIVFVVDSKSKFKEENIPDYDSEGLDVNVIAVGAETDMEDNMKWDPLKFSKTTLSRFQTPSQERDKPKDGVNGKVNELVENIVSECNLARQRVWPKDAAKGK